MSPIENMRGERDADRIRYYSTLAIEHLPQMRLVIRGGKLSKSEKWRNVAEHSIVQVAIARTLSEALGLSNEDGRRLEIAAACHDWNKHLEKRPKDFSDEERDPAQEFLKNAAPDSTLVFATEMEWLPRGVRGEASFLEKLQFYIDDICQGSEIVTVRERIAEVEARDPLWVPPEIAAQLDKPYREKELELAEEIEREVTGKLLERGTDIGEPSQLPMYLKQLIESHYLK
jgi:hypothetical protein